MILNPPSNLTVSTGFATLSPEQVPYTYLYHATTTDAFADYLTKRARGAAYPAVNGGDFEEAEILLPSEALLDEFHRIGADLFDEKDILRQKNGVLRETRDLLLPRLVSGEIDVSELNIDLGGLGDVGFD